MSSAAVRSVIVRTCPCVAPIGVPVAGIHAHEDHFHEPVSDFVSHADLAQRLAEHAHLPDFIEVRDVDGEAVAEVLAAVHAGGVSPYSS